MAEREGAKDGAGWDRMRYADVIERLARELMVKGWPQVVGSDPERQVQYVEECWSAAERHVLEGARRSER